MNDSHDRIDGTGTADRVFGGVIISLLLLSAATVARGSAMFTAPGLDLALDTMAAVVALAVAILALARFRARSDAPSLFQFAAFLVLALANVSTLLPRVTSAAAVDIAGGSSGEGTLYVATIAQLLAAALLVGGSLLAGHRIGASARNLVLVAPAVATLGLVLVAQSSGSALPLNLAGAAAALSQLASAALFVSAAYLSRHVYRRDGSVADGYLIVALPFAAFAELHAALLGTTVGLVTTTDLLWLTFDVVLLAGLAADARSTIVALRDANRSLEVLRDAEVGRAALEERARLARELHDGVAQSLWIAKLKVGRLSGLTVDAEGTELCAELEGTIDAGLAEARQAVMALRLRGSGTFAELMNEYLNDFSDAFGVRTEFDCDEDLPRLAPRAEAELMRIAQEALNNARRHADATVIRVEASVIADSLRLSVADNGRGFETTSTKKGAFGLTSMHERAMLIGGQLTVNSRPRDGTRVSVEIPLVAVSSRTSLART